MAEHKPGSTVRETQDRDPRVGEPLREMLERRGGRSGRERRSVAADLDGGQRLLVVDHLILAIGSLYAHLPQKRAAYASDPVQALVLLRRRAANLTDAEFHAELSLIIVGLRDAHTRYVGPSKLHGHVAVLPFLLEQYGPADTPEFMVTKINSSAVSESSFVPGVKLLSWNGMPMDHALRLHARQETGGRLDSQRSRALESMTNRSLDYGPPPDEDWVVLGYRDESDGEVRELRLDWRVVYPGPVDSEVPPGSAAASRVAIDPAREWMRRAKRLQFASAGERAVDPSVADAIPTLLSDVLAARRLTPEVGYLRIWSFDVGDDELITELTRLLELLPSKALIIDVRANPGGLVWAAERILQLFTDTPIVPVRFSPIASPLMSRLAESPFNRLDLEPWLDSLNAAVSTGELHARPLPLTDPEWCNDTPRRFHGKIVVLADPNTYSSGDIFCAGVVDHAIGELIIANGDATGGGGANVWSSRMVRDALAGLDDQLPSMPAGSSYSLAFRRLQRSGVSDGLAVEDQGVAGQRYHMTREDLLSSNQDLLGHAIRILIPTAEHEEMR